MIPNTSLAVVNMRVKHVGNFSKVGLIKKKFYLWVIAIKEITDF